MYLNTYGNNVFNSILYAMTYVSYAYRVDVFTKRTQILIYAQTITYYRRCFLVAVINWHDSEFSWY